MKVKVRADTFETNSSSTHSFSIGDRDNLRDIKTVLQELKNTRGIEHYEYTVDDKKVHALFALEFARNNERLIPYEDWQANEIVKEVVKKFVPKKYSDRKEVYIIFVSGDIFGWENEEYSDFLTFLDYMFTGFVSSDGKLASRLTKYHFQLSDKEICPSDYLPELLKLSLTKEVSSFIRKLRDALSTEDTVVLVVPLFDYDIDVDHQSLDVWEEMVNMDKDDLKTFLLSPTSVLRTCNDNDDSCVDWWG